MEPEKTSFHGNRRFFRRWQGIRRQAGDIDRGFSLFGTLCVILALSTVGLAILTAVSIRHDFAIRRADQFYEQLDKENTIILQRLQANGFTGTDYALD